MISVRYLRARLSNEMEKIIRRGQFAAKHWRRSQPAGLIPMPLRPGPKP
jgi:hypothetical protein